MRSSWSQTATGTDPGSGLKSWEFELSSFRELLDPAGRAIEAQLRPEGYFVLHRC